MNSYWQAHRELIKLKNVVKVQAALRGFLVRRHAVGTLRCAQAIIKMQAIVRARRAHLSRVRSAQDELYKEIEKENPDSKIAVILLVFRPCHIEDRFRYNFGCSLFLFGVLSVPFTFVSR